MNGKTDFILMAYNGLRLGAVARVNLQIIGTLAAIAPNRLLYAWLSLKRLVTQTGLRNVSRFICSQGYLGSRHDPSKI